MWTMLIMAEFLGCLLVACLLLGPLQVSARESRREEQAEAERARHILVRD